ncbi:winged helix-turn-helix transcriptional regulator [Altererythrobacter lutimaris]|uniref:Helix-turn-helix transcriptional regulator n=1 Tax=Altererythrobacter lutimaris TaxID=2743979 RepID=A0A850H9Z6_9SPHN|nr:helix-turn-helix domain-containing protein [Altererythrobacter lutimaris]NVE93771.1 helix-turn-helix transcriptional regulator [Altererythrobacter lutimaris]
MSSSGSLCPAIKAADMIGDRWVLLIMREFLLGATRYKNFQRALPRISPTVLSNRLKQMEANGLIIKKAGTGQGTEYHLTRCGRELAPLIDQMSKWGLRWARRRIRDEDLDAGSFMWDFHRSLNTGELPDGETVISVTLKDTKTYGRWWLIATSEDVDLCTDDPGKDVDLYLHANLPNLAEVWMGDVAVREAISSDDLTVTGSAYLVRTIASWFPQSRYSNIRPKRIIE